MSHWKAEYLSKIKGRSSANRPDYIVQEIAPKVQMS